MAISYSWSYPALDVTIEDAEGLENVVYIIHWRYSADDGEGHEASFIGTSSVTYDPEGPDPFIPYEDLTEADIQGWVEADLGEEQIAAMQASFDTKIAEQITPTHETKHNMPWDEDDGA
mgnify:FL=1